MANTEANHGARPSEDADDSGQPGLWGARGLTSCPLQLEESLLGGQQTTSLTRDGSPALVKVGLVFTLLSADLGFVLITHHSAPLLLSQDLFGWASHVLTAL